MTRCKRIVLACVAAVATAAAFLAAPRAAPPLVLSNASPSVPTGLYLRRQRTPARGDIVAVRPPQAARSYLAALGYPREALLLKRIAAEPGEVVCAEGDTVTVAGRPLPRRARDRGARPLPRWSGCRTLGGGERLLLGDTPASFDGRYFGPVGETHLVGVYERLG